MKNMKRLVIFVCMVFLAGCADNGNDSSEHPLIGTWNAVYDLNGCTVTANMTLSDDHEFTLSNNPEGDLTRLPDYFDSYISGEWQIRDDLLYLTRHGDEVALYYFLLPSGKLGISFEYDMFIKEDDGTPYGTWSRGSIDFGCYSSVDIYESGEFYYESSCDLVYTQLSGEYTQNDNLLTVSDEYGDPHFYFRLFGDHMAFIPADQLFTKVKRK